MWIKAASISYAVFMAALTGVFCYGLVLVFSLNTNLEDHYTAQSNLVQDRFSALAYAKLKFNELDPGVWTDGPGLNPGIDQRFKKQSWGLFWNLFVQSVQNKDSLTQNFLVAPQMEDSDPTLYLRDNDEPLKLSGVTKVEGLVKCSSQSIRRVRISSDTKMQIEQHGPVEISKKQLPAIKIPQMIHADSEGLEITQTEDEIFIGFDEPQGILKAFGQIENISLSGHILVESSEPLFISASARLKDVIITAPKVVVEEGFTGSLQILADHQIILQNEVTLAYPSALVVQGSETETAIIIGEACQISGAVILQGAGLANEQDHLLQIGLDSQLIGQIYCGGVLELYGDVEGQIITSSLLYQANATKYTNLLKDITLAKPEHPEWLFGLDQDEEISPIIIIKKV